MARRYSWRCCGIQSGSYRTMRSYLRAWSNHRRWYHHGKLSTYSTYGGFTPYP